MRVRYTPRAFGDREAIFEYLNERSPRAAKSVRGAIIASIRLLADFPDIAPLTAERDVRELTVPRYPYKVYYRIAGGEVLIIHIRDARRAPWLSRN